MLLKAQGHTKQGFLRKAYNEMPRPYRSHALDREKQIIRQIASQIYYFLKPGFRLRELPLEEIQILNLKVAGKRNLFIAANPWLSAKEIYPTINKAGNSFTKVLKTDHKHGNAEEKIRTQRYAKKLSSRIFNDKYSWGKGDDAVIADELGKLIRKATVSEMPFDLSSAETDLAKAILENDGGVFILVPSDKYSNEHMTNNLRHAEEYLVDLVNFTRDVLKKEPDSQVGGKKRPCSTCAGAMLGRISRFNPRPGRAWLHGFIHQDEIAARNSFAFFAAPSFVSLAKSAKGKPGKIDPGHDSGSDTEPD
jgi:hypothetical protein